MPVQRDEMDTLGLLYPLKSRNSKQGGPFGRSLSGR